jgi:hypothetical protein
MTMGELILGPESHAAPEAILATLDRIMFGIESTKALQPIRIRRPRGRNGRVSSARQD